MWLREGCAGVAAGTSARAGAAWAHRTHKEPLLTILTTILLYWGIIW